MNSSVKHDEDCGPKDVKGRDVAETDRSISQTLDRGLQVLDIVASSVHGVTINEIVERLDSHRSNVTRLLHTLVLRRYIVRAENGTYLIGPHLLEMARYVEPMMRVVAQPVLQHLADQLGATTHLTVAQGSDAHALQVVEPRTATYHIAYQAGTRRPLARGASGFAILAGRPASNAELPEVALARKKGWAASSGQIERGTWGIAAALPHPDYRDYSIGAIYLGEPDSPDEVADKILTAAKKITDAIG